MGGLKPRLRRHLGDHKKLHWHIDYLLQKACIKSILLCETDGRAECTIARALGHQFDSIPGFGSSDCKCRSHLFLASVEMNTSILTILNPLKMRITTYPPAPLIGEGAAQITEGLKSTLATMIPPRGSNG